MWILEPKLVWAGGILISFTSLNRWGTEAKRGTGACPRSLTESRGRVWIGSSWHTRPHHYHYWWLFLFHRCWERGRALPRPTVASGRPLPPPRKRAGRVSRISLSAPALLPHRAGAPLAHPGPGPRRAPGAVRIPAAAAAAAAGDWSCRWRRAGCAPGPRGRRSGAPADAAAAPSRPGGKPAPPAAVSPGPAPASPARCGAGVHAGHPAGPHTRPHSRACLWGLRWGALRGTDPHGGPERQSALSWITQRRGWRGRSAPGAESEEGRKYPALEEDRLGSIEERGAGGGTCQSSGQWLPDPQYACPWSQQSALRR